jgi:hypothetical protein
MFEEKRESFDMQSLVESLRHTTAVYETAKPVAVSSFVSIARDYWVNASRVSQFAQHFADPYSDDALGATAADVVQQCAILKMELLRSIAACVCPKSVRVRYTQQAFQQYKRLRDVTAAFGAQVDPLWGLALPHRL